jgi:hypothetical protein
MQDVAKLSQQKSEKLKAVASGLQDSEQKINAYQKKSRRTYIFRENSTS